MDFVVAAARSHSFWSPEVDKKLTMLVKKHGIRWTLISQELDVGANGKQCRERWINNLDPSINHDPFLKEEDMMADTLKVIHMDADLYSSSLFVLSALAPYLRKGDLVFFDEFNVPNHEFAAWYDFTRSFYVEYEVLGAVNNFYQTCFRITKTPFRES